MNDINGNDEYTELASLDTQEQLDQIKKYVRDWYEYWKQNNDRYHNFIKFVYDTALSNEDVLKLQSLQKPQIEFNICEVMINRILGDFIKQEPSVVVHTLDSADIEFSQNPEYLQQMKILEGFFRDLLHGANNDSFQYEAMKSILAGGQFVGEVYPDYINETSLDYTIKFKAAFDTTLCGFDPLARTSHKGDGDYCFQVYPLSEEEFIATYGKTKLDTFTFSRATSAGAGIEGFNWSYWTQKRKIVLVCEFYKKRKKNIKIVKLEGGEVISEKEYNSLVKQFELQRIPHPKVISRRTTQLDIIDRYIFCETRLIEHQETDYKFLPYVFFDGNSQRVKNSQDDTIKQMTRPMLYNIYDIQKLKNYCGQTLAAEIENIRVNSLAVAAESIPSEYKDAYRNPQAGTTIIWNHLYKGDPSITLPPPIVLPRADIPPIIESVFTNADNMAQAMLGTYDSVMGINQQDVSGRALQEGAIHTSMAVMPYINGYINGINRMLEITLDLIPKYLSTPRSLPMRDSTGKRSYQTINHPTHPDSISFTYRPGDLGVKVEAGVNATVQKNMALDLMIKTMQANPAFADFMAHEGLEVFIDNMDMRGIDQVKAKIPEYLERVKQAQQAQEDQQGQQDPQLELMKMMQEVEAMKVQLHEHELQLKAKQSENELAIKTAQIALEKERTDAQVAKIMSEIQNKEADLLLKAQKYDSDVANQAIKAAMDLSHHNSKGLKEENT